MQHLAQTLAQVWPFSCQSLPLVVQHCEVEEGHFVATLQRLALQTHALWRSSWRCPAQTHSECSSSRVVSWCPGVQVYWVGSSRSFPRSSWRSLDNYGLMFDFPLNDGPSLSFLKYFLNAAWWYLSSCFVCKYFCWPKNDLDQFIASWRCGWGG